MTRTSVGRFVPRALVGLAWLGVFVAARPAVEAVQGNFRIEAPAKIAKGELALVGAAGAGSKVRLDTATALVLAYSAQCSTCKANTDNWLRLVADLRASHPGVPIFVVTAPQDREDRAQLPESLRGVVQEYRFVAGDVATSFDTRMTPATIVLRHGHVEKVVYGYVGPRRRPRLLASFTGAAQ